MCFDTIKGILALAFSLINCILLNLQRLLHCIPSIGINTETVIETPRDKYDSIGKAPVLPDNQLLYDLYSFQRIL